MKTNRFLLASFFLSSVLCPLTSAFSQGSLTPPGAPAPTFKTLQQVEPRIDLQNAPASAVDTTNASYHFIINQAGSYYLSANLGVTKTNGIQINVEGVTLDLNGFEVSRASGSGGSGIEIPTGKHRASVRNGSIRGFSIGLAGVLTRACAFRDLAVSNCTNIGIYSGDGAVLEFCRAHDNSGTYGIYANVGSSLTNCSASNNTVDRGIQAAGSSLTNCTASNNTASFAIFVSGGSSLTNCSAYNNTADYGIAAGTSTITNCAAYYNQSVASASGGFAIGSGSTITHCAAYFNTTNATPSLSTGMGIDAGDGVIIKDCTTNSNQGDGIRVAGSCLVTGCNSSQNGPGSPNGDGIRATGDNNRIDGNVVNGNSQFGIRTVGTSIVVRNNASGNGAGNYNVNTGAKIGPIQTPDTATSPWANF